MTWPDLEQFLTDVEFARIVAEESKRTLYVQPDQLDRARWLVEQNGAERFITVVAHPFLTPGMWLLVDEQTIDAGLREDAQHALRYLFEEPGPYYVPRWWQGLGGWTP